MSAPPSPQGFLASDPDLELLLNKISAVNHLLSSLEKKVPAPRRVGSWAHTDLAASSRGYGPLPWAPSPTIAPNWRQLSRPHPVPSSFSSRCQVLRSLQDTVSRHNLALPSLAAPPPATKPLAAQCFEVRARGGPGASVAPGWGPPQEPLPVPQVKVGKSQRAALRVDVELGTVTVAKKGSGSPEEIIPQDKSMGPGAGGRAPRAGGSPPDGRRSVLQLIKYQSVQSKVRLVYDRDPQRSLSKDFVFPSARVSTTSPFFPLFFLGEAVLGTPARYLATQ